MTFGQTKQTDSMPLTYRSENVLKRIIIYYTVVLSPTVNSCSFELHVETPFHHSKNVYLIYVDLNIIKIPRKGFYTNEWSGRVLAWLVIVSAKVFNYAVPRVLQISHPKNSNFLNN